LVSLSAINDENNENNLDDWISQADAARILGVSRQYVAKMIKRKLLSWRKIAGRVVVRKSEILAFTPNPVGRPPKKDTQEETQEENQEEETE
jgi:Helix-turn-helix domain